MKWTARSNSYTKYSVEERAAMREAFYAKYLKQERMGWEEVRFLRIYIEMAAFSVLVLLKKRPFQSKFAVFPSFIPSLSLFISPPFSLPSFLPPVCIDLQITASLYILKARMRIVTSTSNAHIYTERLWKNGFVKKPKNGRQRTTTRTWKRRWVLRNIKAKFCVNFLLKM